MSSWPEYAEIRFADYGEEIVASEERTDMERGPSKMRALNSRVMARLLPHLGEPLGRHGIAEVGDTGCTGTFGQ